MFSKINFTFLSSFALIIFIFLLLFYNTHCYSTSFTIILTYDHKYVNLII